MDSLRDSGLETVCENELNQVTFCTGTEGWEANGYAEMENIFISSFGRQKLLNLSIKVSIWVIEIQEECNFFNTYFSVPLHEWVICIGVHIERASQSIVAK